MKKIFLIQIFLMLSTAICQAQSYPLSIDSMITAENPGRFYVEYLRRNTIWTDADTVEGDYKHENAKAMEFWMDRITGGGNSDSFSYKYCHMMKNYTRGGCTPEPGTFNGNWENTGPKTNSQSQGRVYDMYVDPANSNNILMGTGNAGLWKTTNANSTPVNWTCISDQFANGLNVGLPAGAGISAIAVSPFDPYDIYVATRVEGGGARRNLMTEEYGQGVWRTTDGGTTWSIDLAGINGYQVFDELEYCPYKVNNGNDEMLIATQYGKVWQKIGNGNWTNITPPVNATWPLLIRDITFRNGVNGFGKFYLSTQHNWLETAQNVMTYFGPKIYEGTYNAAGFVTWTELMNDTNFGNGFEFNGLANSPTNTALAFETAYAGSNILYVIVAGSPQFNPSLTEGHHTIYTYNISTNVWTVEYPMPYCNPCKSMWAMGIEVSPNSPNVVYLDGVRSLRAWKDALGNWHDYEFPNTGNAFHDDTRKVRIYTANPINSPYYGVQDVVYFGNDGGLTRAVGNVLTNLNGDIITNEVYDIDVAELGRKRAVATFDNGIHARSGNGLWDFQQFGDGFGAIYDKRFDKFTVPLLYHHDDQWENSNHGNSLILGGAMAQHPRRTGAGEIDYPRPFEFPHQFDEGIMYAGNRNMLSTANFGYNTGPKGWTRETDNGDLTQQTTTENEMCRAIAVSPNLGNGWAGQRMYFGWRFPDKNLNNERKTFFYRDNAGIWTEDTPPEIRNGRYNLTDIVIDDKNPKRVFVSCGMVAWDPNFHQRVYVGTYDPVANDITWLNMSDGLPELPVTCLAYQKGSDDVIYAGTDGGVYRWDKPLNCWVKFDDALAGSGAKMPNVVVHDLVIDYCNLKLVMGSYSRGVWESDLYLPNFFPDPTEVIEQSMTWGSYNPAIITNKVIEGSILVKAGAVLTIAGITNNQGNTATTSNTNIYMPKWGRILVEKGAMLIVNGARITNECGTTWMGIYAYGKGNAAQWVDPTSGIDLNHGRVIISNAIIEHAEEALNNFGGDSSPNSNTGGIIGVSNSHFINNFRSAAFHKYKRHDGIIFLEDLSKINGSLFDFNDNARIPFYAHISMWGTRGILIEGNEFNNARTIDATNPSHNNGILSIDASYYFDRNEVNDFYQGIESGVFDQGQLYPIRIYKNVFDRNEIGVHLMGVWGPEITYNTINIGHRQTIGSGSFFSLGSKLESIFGFDYFKNVHTKTFTAPSNIVHYTAGTEIYNTGDNDENIHRNTYNNLKIGNDGDMTCANQINDLIGLNYFCNINNGNTDFDFIFQANPWIRKIQTGTGNNNTSASNTFSDNTINPVISWNHTTGGNDPVNYLNNTAAPLEDILQTTWVNVLPILSPPTSCTPFYFNVARLDSSDYKNLTDAELLVLKTQFASFDSAFTVFNTLYVQLLDGGNTESLVEEISNATIAEQLTTRADFLSISPYVTQEALRELGIQQIVSSAIYLEILLANPSSTNSETFISFLENELPNPLPAYMIDLVRVSWTTNQTPRFALEKNLSYTHNNLTMLKNHIVNTFLLSDSLRSDDSAFTWFQKVPSLRNSYKIIEYLMYHGETSTADSLLDSLAVTYKMSARDSIERAAFINLYNFKKALLADSLEIDQLDSTRKATLIAIADAADYTFPRTMARSALCFFYHICYPDTVRALPSSNGNKTIPIKKQTEKTREITVYPNPAKEYVVCYYNLVSKSNEAEMFLVSDVTGKQVYKAVLKGAHGQHIWDTRNVGNGNYIYTVITSSGEKYSGKVMIQK